MKLSGNTILITGGTSGIGFEMAKELLKKGNTVIVTGRDTAKLDRVKTQLPEIHVIQSDVSQAKEVQALRDKVTNEFPDLNVLVNNAGIWQTIDIQKENDLEDLTKEIDINLKGPIRMVQAFLPHLKKKTASAIVNISSGLAFVPFPVAPVYCSTKAALHSFSLSLRVQLKNTPVKIFEIAPPATQTELLSDFSSDDMKGISIMKVEEMVRLTLQGIEQNKYEVTPGQSSQLKFMNRVAPQFILDQLSKTVDGMLKHAPSLGRS
ncbi:MAG TPA: SDR family NAD(P)-dependent oxidoreductase [bacterium]|nr:SDR family NAD(P)-dependent oxidoreductase [bacterium]